MTRPFQVVQAAGRTPVRHAQEEQLISEAAHHGPAVLLAQQQSPDCDGNESGADPLGLVQPEDEPTSAQNQRRVHSRARHRGLRLSSQEQVTHAQVFASVRKSVHMTTDTTRRWRTMRTPEWPPIHGHRSPQTSVRRSRGEQSSGGKYGTKKAMKSSSGAAGGQKESLIDE